MSLKYTIRKILKEEENSKIKLLIYNNFDKVFNNLDLVPIDDNLLMDWIDKKGKKLFQRNWWGKFWINNCEVYRDLRRFTKLFSMSVEEFEIHLIEYLNEKYKGEFENRPLQEVGDEYGCLEDEY